MIVSSLPVANLDKLLHTSSEDTSRYIHHIMGEILFNLIVQFLNWSSR